MVKIITETKTKECRKWGHEHKGISALMKELLHNYNYCPECGINLKEKRAVTTSRCSGCSEPLLLTMNLKHKFCPNCGEKFEE